MDGLEPGFLLIGVGDRLGSGGLEIGYTALVRNKTKQPITFLVRLLQYDGYDVPYTRNNTVDSIPPGPTERAKGVRHTDLGRDAVNLVTLAPGESVLVPGQEAHHNLRVLIGNGDGGKSPHFAKIKEGMDMLVQPLTVYRSPDLTLLTRDLARYSVTKFAPDGTTRTESSVRVSMPNSGGTTLEAQLWLSKIVGTSVTPAAPTPDVPIGVDDSRIKMKNIHWSYETVVDGLQTGFLLTEASSTKIGYTVLLRNRADKPITFLVRLLQYDGYEVPYTENHNAKRTHTERAKGVRHTDLGRDAVYQVTLAPRETVLVPGQEARHHLQALFGGVKNDSSPRFDNKESMMDDVFIQPITVYSTWDVSKLTRDLGHYSVTKMAPDGTIHTEIATRVSMPESGGTTLKVGLSLSKIGETPATPEPPAASITREPSETSDRSEPMIPLNKVIWSKAVNGLEAGFLLTSSPRIPLNSKLTYQTLVRNASNKPISFMTRLLQYDGYDVPSVGGKRTKGAKRTYPLDPLYEVTLAPGESVLVPGNTGVNLAIYVGDGDSDGSPSIAEITPGHQKIVQPITIYRSPDHSKLPLLEGIDFLTKVSPDGRTRSELATRASGGKGRIEGGQTLEAYIYLEVGTLNAAAERNASAAVWGKVDKNLQCGIRMLNTTRTFKTGDTLEAEILWRNTGDKPANWVLPRKLDLYPMMHSAAGQHLTLDMGARFDLLPGRATYAPGESRSLGVISIKLVPEKTPSPKSNMEPAHITLAPGTYKLSGSGGVSGAGDPNPRSGEIEFKLISDEPQNTENVEGLQLSLRLPRGVKTFAKLSQTRFEVLLRNTSDKPLTASWITPANFDFYGPDIFTQDGEPIPYIKTLAGPYLSTNRNLVSGETIVLGTIEIPGGARVALDALPRPGLTVSTDLIIPPLQFYAYEARFSLGVTIAGKSEQKLTARLPFTVTRR